MNWKETYTKIFLKQADIALSDPNIKQYMSDWWKNTRGKSAGGLRLTDEGFDFLQERLDIQVYEVPFPKDFKFTTQTYIFLDQFISCPYYLTTNSIWVTDERKSMELHLFSGDLRKYGLTKAMKRHEE
jgi:hypothetical protein|tara:strand:+ start:1277 stop:1660 length:384 start_codon:yes stop_codon:yes gene_type:complete